MSLHRAAHPALPIPYVQEHTVEQLNQRPGCLSGILKLFVLERVYSWLQRNFGFGRGCLGAGCGVIFFILFIGFACSILFGTNWFDFRF